MARAFDAVLLLAFGGPRSAAEVRPFVESVAKGRPIKRDRVEKVIAHYQAIGGGSPMNRRTFEQARSLEALLARRGRWLPVYVGMKNWHPFIRETLVNMSEEAIKQALAIVLSPHRTEAGYERYVREIEKVKEQGGETLPEIDFASPWHNHRLFVKAQAECAAEGLSELPSSERSDAHLLFTAHSVPREMAAVSGYEEQVEESATLVAEHLGWNRWSVAYQSRSGRPEDEWTEPAVEAALRELMRQGTPAVVVVPIGFVCDHVEVLFDLDIEARQVAGSCGLRFVRAPALNSRPAFLEMLGELVGMGQGV